MKLDKFIHKESLKFLLKLMMVTSLVSGIRGVTLNRGVKLSYGTYKELDLYNGLYEIDFDVNRSNLKKVRYITFDCTRTDINDLVSMPNLSKVTLKNFEVLTKRDKDIINSLKNLRSIYLELSDNSFRGLDLDWIREDIDIFLTYDLDRVSSVFRDLEGLRFYKLVMSLDDKIKSRIILPNYFSNNIEEYVKLDYEFTKIVESFGFNEDTSDEEKIIKILNYVISNVDYDPLVESFLTNKDMNEEDLIEVEKRLEAYNDNSLEFISNDDKIYGVCCNFASLVSVLGYYADVKLDYVIGYYQDRESSNGHAWCSYSHNGSNVVIDPTYLDGNKELMLKYLEEHYAKWKEESNLFDLVIRNNIDDYLEKKSLELIDDDYVKVIGYKNIFGYVNEDKVKYYKKYFLETFKVKLFISIYFTFIFDYVNRFILPSLKELKSIEEESEDIKVKVRKK